MEVLSASSWGVFAALTDAVHALHHQCSEKNGPSNCGTWVEALPEHTICYTACFVLIALLISTRS